MPSISLTSPHFSFTRTLRVISPHLEMKTSRPTEVQQLGQIHATTFVAEMEFCEERVEVRFLHILWWELQGSTCSVSMDSCNTPHPTLHTGHQHPARGPDSPKATSHEAPAEIESAPLTSRSVCLTVSHCQIIPFLSPRLLNRVTWTMDSWSRSSMLWGQDGGSAPACLLVSTSPLLASQFGCKQMWLVTRNLKKKKKGKAKQN